MPVIPTTSVNHISHLPLPRSQSGAAFSRAFPTARSSPATGGCHARDRPCLARGPLSPHRGYDTYLRTYGPLNRFTERGTGRFDENGVEAVARIRPPVMRIFGSDPFAQTVAALEHFDPVPY